LVAYANVIVPAPPSGAQADSKGGE
jgi:hypothetical protein